MLQAFKGANESEVGYTIEAICHRLKGQGIEIPRQQVDGILKEMVENAQIYSTSDDFHFKPTEDIY